MTITQLEAIFKKHKATDLTEFQAAVRLPHAPNEFSYPTWTVLHFRTFAKNSPQVLALIVAVKKVA